MKRVSQFEFVMIVHEWDLIRHLLGSHATIKYIKVNEKIELWNKIIYCMLPEISFVGVVSPPMLITFVNYFFYDLKEDSYFLPFPVM